MDKESLINLGICAVSALFVVTMIIMFFYGFGLLLAYRFAHAAIMMGIPAWVGLTAIFWSDRT